MSENPEAPVTIEQVQRYMEVAAMIQRFHAEVKVISPEELRNPKPRTQIILV